MRPVLAAALLFAAALPASAHEVKAGSVTVSHPIVRASVGKVPNTAAYMTLVNKGKTADRLLSASCACARKVEAHGTTTGADGVARMAAAGPIVLPAGGEVAFKPGGRHLMLTGLAKPLEAGTVVELTLVFEKAGRVTAPFFATARVDEEMAHGAHKH
jgi:hypothetical protein